MLSGSPGGVSWEIALMWLACCCELCPLLLCFFYIFFFTIFLPSNAAKKEFMSMPEAANNKQTSDGAATRKQ